MCWAPSATARRPEPQTWLRLQAALSFGRPALMCAWRAGFCPWPAVSTWPRMVSETSSGATPARSSAARITAAPSSCAGVLANAPLKLPTAVRAADAITILVIFPLHRRRIALPFVAAGRTDESPPGASASPLVAHRAAMLNRRCSAADAYPPCAREKPASGRQTSARAALPTIMPTWPVRAVDDLRARQGARRAAGRAAAARCCRSPRRRAAPAPSPWPGRPSRRGSASRRSPARCRSASRAAGPWRRRPASGTPSASQSSSATKSRAAGPSGSSRASFWNLSAAWIGLTSAKRNWKSETGTMPKRRPWASSSASVRSHPLGADDGAVAAGEAVRRRRSPRARRW